MTLHERKLALVTLVLRAVDRAGWEPRKLEYRALLKLHQIIDREKKAQAEIEALRLHFPHMLRVSKAEHSTILAALRFYQMHLAGALRTIYNTKHEQAYTRDVRDIATNRATHDPIDVDAIDDLCERINGKGVHDEARLAGITSGDTL